MRVTAGAIAAATLIGTGILVLGGGPAMASVAAPRCDSSTSRFTCDAVGAWANPVTWTIISTNSGGSTVTHVVTATGHLFSTCHSLDSEQVFYSFFDGTQTQTSGTARFRCNPAPPA